MNQEENADDKVEVDNNQLDKKTEASDDKVDVDNSQLDKEKETSEEKVEVNDNQLNKEKETSDSHPVQLNEVETDDTRKQAGLLVDKYTKWSFGVGFVPVPIVDLVALTSIQIKMISDIAKLYGLSYSDNRIRATITAILGGAFPQSVNRVGLSSLLKSVPFLGTAVSLVAMPIASSTATYAVGHVFIKHFESGGTLLSIDYSGFADQVRALAKRKSETSEEIVTGEDGKVV